MAHTKSINMDSEVIRRSERSNPYDSNGREYLAGQLNVSRKDLEVWILSPTVHPHLLHWYRISISSPQRFNTAIRWINSGDKGYYYDPAGLEDDLLLMCLGEGDGDTFRTENKDTLRSDSYSDLNAKTELWSTQEL